MSNSMTFMLVPSVPEIPQDQCRSGPKWMLYTKQVCTRAEKAKLKEHNFLQECYKQTCLTFTSEGDNIFIILNSKQIYYLPQREAMSLSSKGVHYTNIFEKTVPNKSPQCICSHMTCRNIKDPWKIVSQYPLGSAYFQNRSAKFALLCCIFLQVCLQR